MRAIPRASGSVAQVVLAIPAANDAIPGLPCRACDVAPRGLRLSRRRLGSNRARAIHLNCTPRPEVDPGTRSWIGDYFRPQVEALENTLETSPDGGVCHDVRSRRRHPQPWSAVVMARTTLAATCLLACVLLGRRMHRPEPRWAHIVWLHGLGADRHRHPRPLGYRHYGPAPRASRKAGRHRHQAAPGGASVEANPGAATSTTRTAEVRGRRRHGRPGNEDGARLGFQVMVVIGRCRTGRTVARHRPPCRRTLRHSRHM
jgi:hypothetical protein